jgi:5,10-methylenetetrahydrofolate reductase
VDDADILARVKGLVDKEHELRERHAEGGLDAEQEQRQLQGLEEALDQCWDLLRQRRALREAGQSPDAAQPRPTDEVESYLQ